MFEDEKNPTLSKEELHARGKLVTQGKYIMVRQKKFGGHIPVVWTFYEIGPVNDRQRGDGAPQIIFNAARVRGMVDQDWVVPTEQIAIVLHPEYRIELWDNFAEANHAANYYNLMYRLETMQKKVMINLTDAKPAEAASLIVGTDSPGDYMEFFTVLALFSTLAFKDDEEKFLLQEFYAEIEPNIEKYVAKRMLLGKSFS